MKLQENIYNEFRLPIEYVNHSVLPTTLLDDLEMRQTDEHDNIYECILVDESQNSINTSNVLVNKWSSFYTTDVSFLQDFQTFLLDYDVETYPDESITQESFYNTWGSFKNQTSFKQNYYFLEWEHLDFCNRNPQIMQFMSFYNLISPVLSLLVPVLFLVFPFIILKFVQKIPITLDRYIAELKKQFAHHSIGKIVSGLTDTSNLNSKMMAMVGLTFYVFTIYQNVLICFKFYKNLYSIKETMYKLKQHCCKTVNIIDNISSKIESLSSFSDFNAELIQRKYDLSILISKCDYIQDYTFSIREIFHVGNYMADLYNVFYSNDIHDTVCYSMGLQEFHMQMKILHRNIQDKSICSCSYIQNHSQNLVSSSDHREKHKFTKNSSFVKQYYLPLIYSKKIKNDVSLKNNIIITGPNASGKTTTLKTILINQILSQQIGAGCYKRANVQVYDKFHCYLNIPDTSARDSLFQAEARRCLDIIEEINSDPNTKHLCIFDELFSGTNNNEATQSAKAYLMFLSKLPCRFVITTHYYELTDLGETIENVVNKHMMVKHNKNTYKVKKGVSYQKGGFKVLEDLQYPKEILDMLV